MNSRSPCSNLKAEIISNHAVGSGLLGRNYHDQPNWIFPSLPRKECVLGNLRFLCLQSVGKGKTQVLSIFHPDRQSQCCPPSHLGISSLCFSGILPAVDWPWRLPAAVHPVSFSPHSHSRRLIHVIILLLNHCRFPTLFSLPPWALPASHPAFTLLPK